MNGPEHFEVSIKPEGWKHMDGDSYWRVLPTDPKEYSVDNQIPGRIDVNDIVDIYASDCIHDLNGNETHDPNY